MTPEFKAEFSGILGGSAPANEMLRDANACLVKHKHAYNETKIKCKFIIPHQKNRGGLILSPFNAHRNAGKIFKVGADIKHIMNAVCMELPSDGPFRASHLDAYEALARRAGKLLAPLNGDERYISLGAGHTAAWCKVSELEGPTPEPCIQDGSGNIDIQKVKRQPDFKEMIEEGWSWFVCKDYIDAEFPAYALLAQRALNTSNHVSTEVGELETSCMLADAANDAKNEEGDAWKAAAIENVASLCVPCASYANIIMEFVLEYGGGTDSKGIVAPMIRFIDSVAKQFAANVNLGETFWTAVTRATFASKTERMPMLRAAMILSNLTAPKLEDGLGKLLKRSDVAKMCTAKSFANAAECEDTLRHGVDICDLLCMNYPQKADAENIIGPKGKLFVRVALFAVEKGKLGLEAKEYTLGEIRSLFLEELSELIGTPVMFQKWGDGTKQQPVPSSVHDASNQPKMASLENLNDPVWIAQQAGYKIHGAVVEQGQQVSVTSIYSIDAIGENVTLTQITAYDGNPATVQVPLKVLLSKWSKISHQPPVKMTSGQVRSNAICMDTHKCNMYLALMDLDSMSAMARSLVFWRRPDEVRTSQRIAKGSLTLAPVCQVGNLVTTKTSGCQSLGKFEVDNNSVEFFASSPPKPPLEKGVVVWKPNTTVAAFWWVGTSSVKNEANMAIELVTKKGIDLPVLKNTKDLLPFEKLVRYKAKDASATPLQNATVVTKPLKKQKLS